MRIWKVDSRKKTDPGLRRVVCDVPRFDTSLFPHLAHDCVLERLAGLDEACKGGVEFPGELFLRGGQFA
jgi:hypothetical protein